MYISPGQGKGIPMSALAPDCANPLAFMDTPDLGVLVQARGAPGTPRQALGAPSPLLPSRIVNKASRFEQKRRFLAKMRQNLQKNDEQRGLRTFLILTQRYLGQIFICKNRQNQ